MMVWGAIAYGKKWDLERLPLGTEDIQRATELAGNEPQKGRKTGKGLNGDRYVMVEDSIGRFHRSQWNPPPEQ